LDINGVKQLRERNFNAKYLFFTPSSLDELEKRLRSRGTESNQQIELRLKNAVAEIDYGFKLGAFDKVIINNNSYETVEEILLPLLCEWFPQYCHKARK
jgi:guanylate kinase